MLPRAPKRVRTWDAFSVTRVRSRSSFLSPLSSCFCAFSNSFCGVMGEGEYEVGESSYLL